MRKKFRDFEIQRTCKKSYKNYKSYKPYLRKDFGERCAYCNLKDTNITTWFEVDHFIPRDEFKDKWPECDNLYDNLIYSCKKCNMAKGAQYKGNIEDKIIKNDCFYNPVDDDYGKIFYRDDVGGIASDDIKGREMIVRLKLYRPIHNLAWICENLYSILQKLEIQLEREGRDTERGKELLAVKEKVSDYYILCYQTFIANYNNEKFTLNL